MPRSTHDPVRLEVFKHLFAAIAEEMGVVLQRASYSPNIKERQDFSCALFNSRGDMIAQAAHIPVHLGSMPLSVAAAIEKFAGQKAGICPGDVIVLNDPYRGGTHLPDITMVTPVFEPTEGDDSHSIGEKPLLGFVASRAHHADIGGMTSGSMPVAREIYQEGLVIPPMKLVSCGELDQGLLELILANVRTPGERSGDLWAQIAANQRGVVRFQELVARYGFEEVEDYMQGLLEYTERMTRRLIESLPDGTYRFTDYLDDDGVSDQPVPITVAVTIRGDEATVDFTGSAPQQAGSVNAVFAITLSAVYYVFRCLLGLDVPNNSGCLVPVRVIAPEGTVVNAVRPAPVAGGNVETSQRIVDVLLGALAQAVPQLVPAASQGTMNNVTVGGRSEAGAPFAYYETIGGGMGARPWGDGPSAVHSHMTNTLNTPVEALEYAYPLQVLRYEIRRGSGGQGRFRGGDGIRRDLRVLVDAQASLLSERRRLRPYGLSGGTPGLSGANLLIREDEERELPGKGIFYLQSGDVLSIRTPGGGGFGSEEV
ncbi:MAG TPA: hydantoinase B/oxoprolinase family protein [Anaerolineales bacterium]|nr:hydantoinase B/oxoprolinase family protein [Anaerolineales bacterium]